ncbi:hypothetical protein BFP70_16515 [Thioclava sp. SK-1]|uniref:trypsin-like peptidase domain-containing protein n=1 Tax=Thioclava sp. SK-1 TaxID=1889770 RepID=UPI0008267A94|nr:trypsin-like peptidase domain-containing protein [Thioclava sp. SK-1]OCX61054.1 hypothetical protein BFP70_16515 [Thioclava sp. SK-1]
MVRLGKSVSMVVGAVLTGMMWTGIGWAAPVWIQIEAQPSLAQAEQSAREYGTTLPDLNGFAMSTNWYAITIGPFEDRTTADQRRLQLRREGLIPNDAYLTEGAQYRQQFWPVGARFVTPPASSAPSAQVDTLQSDPIVEPSPEVTPDAAQAPVAVTPDPMAETLAQSQALERQLNRDQRIEIQSALQWEGAYDGRLDAAFGPGTRGAISGWQAANGFEPTGVLSSVQHAALLERVDLERARIDLNVITDEEAGIEIAMPNGLVAFDHYDAPFVHYTGINGSDVTVLLISQQGDASSLSALYDAMQTLEIVPIDGERSQDRSGFTLTGKNDQLRSYTHARLSGGLIKGFSLVWPATASAADYDRVLSAMQQSFAPVGRTALDATLGKPLALPRGDILSGLDVRQPEFARSGFFIDASGAIVTAAQGIDTCSRITVEDDDFDVAFTDMDLGVAVLTPRTALAPATIGKFQTAQVTPGAEIAVAGFSYPEALSAPVLSFGALSALAGLENEPDQARLSLRTLPGDVGAPVLDQSGAVVGMVLPRPDDTTKILPDDLSLAIQSDAMAQSLAANGFAPEAADPSGALAAEDLTQGAQSLVVHVACWK